MLCPLCSCPTRIVRETLGSAGLKALVRECTAQGADRHAEARFDTFEIIGRAATAFGNKSVQAAVATAIRGMQRRCTAEDRALRARAMKTMGWRTSRIALELGVTTARVRQLLK